MNVVNNWFAIQCSFRNTVRAWATTYNTPRAIAEHIQAIVTFGATRKEVESVVSASEALRQQVGH